MYHPILSPKKQKERKKKLIIKSVLISLCVISVCYFFVWIFTIPAFQITKITVSGNKVLLSEDIENIAQRDISGKYFFLFPRANVFLYPKEKIQNDIFSAYRRANSVEISLEDDGSTLHIFLSERDPMALWCGAEKDADTNGCFYMDNAGYIFDSSPVFSGNTYLKFYGKGILKEGDTIGHNFISAGLFQKVLEIRNMLEKYDKKIIEIFLGEDSRAELTAESGCKIIFSTDQDFSPLSANMEAVFKSSDWGKKISESDKCAELEYIDFRFGNKIFYKQKGITPVNIPVTGSNGTGTPAVILPAQHLQG